MKIKMTENSKCAIHVSEMPKVREIMAMLKEDDSLNDYAQMAARVASGKNDEFEILKATAEMAQNCRVWDAYGDGTEKLDVWLEVYAYNPYYGFYDLGIYLTDVWAITGDNAEEIKSHMYIKPFIADCEEKMNNHGLTQAEIIDIIIKHYEQKNNLVGGKNDD